MNHLLDIATACRDTVDEASAEFWSNARLYRFINRANQKMWRKMVAKGGDWFLLSHSFSTVSGTKLYDLPAFVLRVRRVSRVESDGSLTPILPARSINNTRGTIAGAVLDPTMGTGSRHIIHGYQMEIRPKPSSVWSVQVDHIPEHPDMVTGTASAGASTTITLESGVDHRDDYYVGQEITITSGTGSGQTRRISDYTGSTRVATVSTAWGTNPDSTSVYATHSWCPSWAVEVVVYEAVIRMLQADERDASPIMRELDAIMPDVRRLLRQRTTMRTPSVNMVDGDD